MNIVSLHRQQVLKWSMHEIACGIKVHNGVNFSLELHKKVFFTEILLYLIFWHIFYLHTSEHYTHAGIQPRTNLVKHIVYNVPSFYVFQNPSLTVKTQCDPV